MTKREARKIATLYAAAGLYHDECLSFDVDSGVPEQVNRLAQKLAERYGYDASSIPGDPQLIEEAVLDGTL